jgi:hypothetical protein
MQDPTIRMNNEDTINGLVSSDNILSKQAQEGVEDYLRLRMYEDGFLRRIQPPVKVGPGDFDKQVDTEKPVIVLDKEPSCPSAYSVPFGTLPIGHYIKSTRFRVMFDRIMTRRFKADVNTLLTYDMDIKQVLEDIMLKKIMHEEDRKYISLVDYIVTQGNPANVDVAAGQNANSVNSTIGMAQNVTFNGLTRATLSYMRKGLPTSNRSLNPSIALVNNLTIWDVAALNRTEAGGDLSEEMFVNGFGERTIMGLKWVVTIKKDLVPSGVIYQFAEPKYLGRLFILDDVTLSTKKEDMFITMYMYECLGAAIGNDAAVCRCSFNDASNSHSWEDGAVL